MTYRIPTFKVCPRCGRRLKSLGYARHMAMHRDWDKLHPEG